MRIGIDVSQVVYEGTGVGRYIRELIPKLITMKPEYEFVLFGAAKGRQKELKAFMNAMQQKSSRVRCVFIPIPPSFLDFLWNKLHIIPVTWVCGPLDVFWSSDWTQPPIPKNVIGMTTIHDVSFFVHPESFVKTIVSVQRRRLLWAKRECSLFLCDSDATKKDVWKFLHIPEEQLTVVYPGYTQKI